MIVTETPREGWAVATRGGETVALDLELTAELRRAGPGPRGRPAGAGGPQDQPGFEVSDRIELWWQRRRRELAAALREHGALIAGEVLATAYRAGRRAGRPLGAGRAASWG